MKTLDSGRDMSNNSSKTRQPVIFKKVKYGYTTVLVQASFQNHIDTL